MNSPRKIKNWPSEDRPREKLLSRGPASLTETEILAVIIGTGHSGAGTNALDLARTILTRFETLDGLDVAAVAELTAIAGVGKAKAAQIKAALELARRLYSFEADKTSPIKTSSDIFNEFRVRLKHLRHEVFIVLLLDSRFRKIKDITIAQGSLTTVSVHPREVLIPVIRESAAAIALVHNHPSGDPSPSMVDFEITQRIQSSAMMLGVQVLDHVIIGDGTYASFADQGLLRTVPIDEE